jgi:hypothetical protein
MRPKPRFLYGLFALLGTLACANSEAQHAVRMQMSDATEITVTAPEGVPEIPFKLINNHLILPITIQGQQFDAILDTGMPAPGLALYGGSRVEALELDIDPAMQVQVGGAGGDGRHKTAQMAMNASFELPGVEIDQTRIIVLPSFHFNGYHDGIIGYSLFDRFVVELDYDSSVMRLHDPASFEAPERARVLPFTLRNNKPFVTVQVTPNGGEPYAAEVVVDLGAAHAISLNTGESPSIRRPADSIETVLGRGLLGEVHGQVGRIAQLGLDDIVLENVLASFPVEEHQNPSGMNSYAGNLGSEVLRRFTTIFDYSRERMLLIPNESFSEPFLFDRSGVRFDHDQTLRVEQVLPGSPAAEAGIEVGDVVTHLDGDALSGEDVYDLREALRGSGEVRITLLRADQALEKRLTLRQLI